VEVHLDAAGRPTESRIHRGFMKSRAKLHYGGVARALGLTAEGPRQEAAEAMREDLQIAFELSRLLRSRRLKRGALDFDLPDAKVVLDEKGNVVDVAKRSQDPGVKKAYQLIEELMLLANETVATWLVGRNLPAIFRIHEAPDEAKLERLAAFSEQAGMPFDIDEAKDPKALARVLKGWVDHPAASVFHMLLLRSMKQASYDVVNLGHFGLASKAYLHFTSPIRRYPDLVVHRVVHAALLGERVPRRDKDDEALRDAALASSTAERRAMEVERAVVDLHRAILMQGRIGDQFEGTVTSLVGSGVFVAIDSPFVDVLLRFEDLAAEPFEISDDGLFAYGVRSGERIALGDRLVVAITDAAVLRRTVYGRRVAHLGGYADEGRPRRRRAQVVEAPPRRVAKQKPVREAAPRRAPSRKATASKGGRGKGGKGKGGRR
jgi:ribonuclease R